MVASILGSHLVSAALTKQRNSIYDYLHALLRSEEKFRKIFETSGSPIAIHTIPGACTIDVNPAWERTFGYRRHEVLGRAPADLAITPDPGGFVRWVNSLKIGDAGAARVPAVLRGARGNLVHCVYSWTTLELNGRNCVLIVGQDVTARVEAEEALRLNREVLVNQERLKAVGELASGIAHDLNNSLNALRLRVELLCSDAALLSRHSDALQLISRIVRDAAATIGRLQDFARRGHELPVENVDLNAILAQSVEIAKSTLEDRNLLLGRSIRVELKVPRLPLIVAEPAELRQVFLNLLLNAQDAMPAGGTISITGDASNGKIVVTVKDEGQGIPEENLNRIFDPFFTTKDVDKGTGLGLSQVYGFARRSGGTVLIDSELQRGTTVTLYLPRSHELLSPAVVDTRGSRKGKRSGTILVVEDNDDVRGVAAAMLQQLGYFTLEANSAMAALEKLDAGVRVDLVFSDIVLPGAMDGLALAVELQSRHPPTPVLLTTGYAKRILSEIPQRVLRKPYDLIKLDGAVHEAIISIQHLDHGESDNADQRGFRWFPTWFNR